ncbi:hypothetical protein S40288_11494 [Stachybotrys chartarum IBT 40288]|nr:hypothetical protein S40288_11494 [Stachybotrys chartarum IBT 40288]
MFGFRRYDANSGQYQKVDRHDKEDFEKSKSLNDEHDSNKTESTSSTRSDTFRTSNRGVSLSRAAVFVLAGVNLLLSVALLWVTAGVARRSSCQPDTGIQRLGQADIPVEMELYRFRAGVTEKTAFWGPPNATTDAAWSTILNGE